MEIDLDLVGELSCPVGVAAEADRQLARAPVNGDAVLSVGQHVGELIRKRRASVSAPLLVWREVTDSAVWRGLAIAGEAVSRWSLACPVGETDAAHLHERAARHLEAPMRRLSARPPP